MKHHLLSHKPIYILFFIFLILHSRNPTRAVDVILDEPLVYCMNGSTYAIGSQFETNLNLLLPSLTTNGPLNITTFYNTSYGKEPDRVYGFAQCMSGAPIDDCRLCLNNSRVQILQNCPNSRRAAVRYIFRKLFVAMWVLPLPRSFLFCFANRSYSLREESKYKGAENTPRGRT